MRCRISLQVVGLGVMLGEASDMSDDSCRDENMVTTCQYGSIEGSVIAVEGLLGML